MPSSHSFSRRNQLRAFGAACGVALFLGPMPHAIAQGAASAVRALDSADQKFVLQAAQGGMAEVAMGQMAQQRGSHAEVKSFGERMVGDHGKANEELKQLATAKGVQLPATLAPAHQKTADSLGKLSGAGFDRAYMKHMVDDHKKDVADFEKAAKSAKDAEVKGFAARTLPTLKTHLDLAQKTYAAVK